MECSIINVDWCNFIVTSLLSILLIVLTVRISRKQNKLQEQISEQQNDLQKRISNDQNQLQKLIAAKDIQVALYQHRMNCYLQIMQALDIVCYLKIDNLLASFNNKESLGYVTRISQGRDMLYKVVVESEAIFNKTWVEKEKLYLRN